MVSALYAIAVAMIAGGSYIANAGYEIILVERGWSQVIAGSVIFTGGVVLLGVASVVLRLGKINKTLLASRTISAVSSALPPVRVEEAAPHVVISEPRQPESQVSFAGNKDLFEPEQETMSSFALEEARLERIEQEKAVSPLPVVEESYSFEEEIAREVAARNVAAAASSEPIVADTNVVKAELTDEHEILEQPFIVTDAEQSSKVWAETTEALTEEAEIAQTSADVQETASQHSVVEEVLPKAETKAEDVPQPTVIGSYDSGGNQYVMYSDGSIEAHLPTGLHRFESLDELKQFIGNLKAS